MKPLRTIYTVAALIAAASGNAHSQGLRAVSPMPGWTCMMLNLTEQQSMDPSVRVPVRAEPSEASPPIGYAAATVAVRVPIAPVNGFIEAMFPSGRPVWIAANLVRPWHSLGDPTARCIPAMLSNGKPGFAYPH